MATQTQRRAATRTALLEAATESLLENGLAGLTTPDVVHRSGLSNGALFRYFSTRSELVAATVGFIFAKLRRDYEESFAALDPAAATLEKVLELLWSTMKQSELAAVYEVYTAARTDDWLRAAIEPVAESHVEELRRIGRAVLAHVGGVDPEVADHAVWFSIMVMQGMVLDAMVRRRHDVNDSVLDQLTRLGAVAVGLSAITPEGVTC